MHVSAPTVFTLTEKPRHMPGIHRYKLRLYCAQPNEMHQLPDDKGCYDITVLAEWAGALVRHLSMIVPLLKGVTGLTGTIMGVAAADLLERGKQDLDKVHEALDKVKSLADSAGQMLTERDLLWSGNATEADIRIINKLLNSVLKEDNWGGLSKCFTPEGLTLYLCEHHAKAYNLPSPRPLGMGQQQHELESGGS
jgi:hypothetical protein